MRICSLLPSATEIVYALGMGDQLVAVTHECDYPLEARHLPVVTRNRIAVEPDSSRAIHNRVSRALHSGTSIYELDLPLLRRLQPELILTQELCTVCAVSYDDVREAARQLPGNPTVLSLEPTSLGGILESIRQVALVARVSERADPLVTILRRRIERAATSLTHIEKMSKVLALEWFDPPFVAGHWVPEMIRHAGGYDGIGVEGRPSFEASWTDIVNYNPDLILCMPCGFDLNRTINEFIQCPWPNDFRGLKAVLSSHVYAVDGSSYFNRPGPRIIDGLEILCEILHPEIFPRRSPKSDWHHLNVSGLSA